MANAFAQEAEAALKAGDLSACAVALTNAVKAEPANAKLRTFMFQLLCLRGEWDRAITQLNVVSEMDSAAIAMKQVYEQPVYCERLRSAVFSGKKVPMVFGNPSDWLAKLIEALLVEAGGDVSKAAELRAAALAEAPSTGGEIDGNRFEWIADADSRLGPVLEAIINNRYYWVPFEHLSKVDIEAPEDLRDRVWMPAHLEFTNGGDVLALIPTRYPGSESSGRDELILARATEWLPQAGDSYHGLGQRVFATDAADFALMDVRSIKFDETAASAVDASAEAVDG
jgi:type VI secretion system protein ImpE